MRGGGLGRDVCGVDTSIFSPVTLVTMTGLVVGFEDTVGETSTGVVVEEEKVGILRLGGGTDFPSLFASGSSISMERDFVYVLREDAL